MEPCRCCRPLISAEKRSMAAAAPARQVCRGPGAPSADRPVRLTAPSAPALAPPQSPQSLCLQPGRHSRSEARAPQGPRRPGVTWRPGTGWREASHPGGGGLLPSGLPSLQPESQSSSPDRSPGGAASWALGPGVGGGQGCSSLAVVSSRMSGGRNSRPRRYSSSPWREAGRDDQIPRPGPPGEAPGRPGASGKQGQRGFWEQGLDATWVPGPRWPSHRAGQNCPREAGWLSSHGEAPTGSNPRPRWTWSAFPNPSRLLTARCTPGLGQSSATEGPLTLPVDRGRAVTSQPSAQLTLPHPTPPTQPQGSPCWLAGSYLSSV